MTKAEDVRKARIATISEVMRKIFNNGENILKEKLISNLTYEYGVARRLALEYINSAHALIDFEEKEGIYYANKAAVAEKVC